MFSFRRKAILLSLLSNLVFINKTSFEIVELKPEDWHLFRDLRLASIQETPQAFGSTYEEELNETEYNWKRRLNLNMLFAKCEGRIVGMIGAVIDSREKVKHVAMLISFYVAPEHRGKGVGSALLKKIIDKLNASEEIEKIFLKVTADQVDAINLYHKFGFSTEGILRKEYLVNGRYYDQCIMSKFTKSFRDSSLSLDMFLSKRYQRFI